MLRFDPKSPDTQGKKVKDILNAHKPAGTYNINFDAGDLESGVYFLRLDTNKSDDVKKVIVVK